MGRRPLLDSTCSIHIARMCVWWRPWHLLDIPGGQLGGVRWLQGGLVELKTRR